MSSARRALVQASGLPRMVTWLPRATALDAEALLDQRQVLVEFAEERRHQPVVVEGDDDVRFGFGDRCRGAAGARGQAVASSRGAGRIRAPGSARLPKRLLLPTASIVTRAMVPDQFRSGFDLDRQQPGRAADDLPGRRPFRSNSTSVTLPMRARPNSACLARIERLQAGEALGLDGFADLLVHGRRRGARPRAVFEGVGRGVADLLDETKRVVEIGVALAGEADDEIAGERDVGPRLADALDDARDSRPRVWRRFIAARMRSDPDCTGRCR